MYMGILFIEMCNKRRYILLAILVTDESIGILCPLLNFRLSDDPAVVRSLLEIYILLSKGKLPHQLAGAAEDNVDHRPVLGLHQSFVRVLNTPQTETVGHPIRNAPAFVHRTHLAVYYLKVQMFPCRVVVTFLHGIFRRLLTAVTQMFVALGGGDSFGDLNVENLFCICHTASSVALDNLSCPSLLPAWTSLPMAPVIGVLGSPIGFITGRQASPAWMIASLQIMQMLSGFQCTYKRKYGRLHLYYETCHSFALFPYLHPCIKVKSGNVTEKCHTGILWYRGSIMEIPVEFVFFPFFYDHPLVA